MTPTEPISGLQLPVRSVFVFAERRETIMRQATIFLSAACLLASVTFAADEKPRQKPEQPKRADPAALLERFDKNKDGFLDRSEVPEQLKKRFDRVDANGDGKLSKEELQKVAGRLGNQPRRPRAGATPDLL